MKTLATILVGLGALPFIILIFLFFGTCMACWGLYRIGAACVFILTGYEIKDTGDHGLHRR